MERIVVGRESRALVERSRELGVLVEALAATQGGRGGAVALAGPPGIGKSRMVEAARHLAAADGLQVLHACGHVLERDFGLGVARQLFGSAIADASPATREELMTGPAALAVTLIEGRSPDRRPAGGTHGMLVAHSLYWLTLSLSASSPVLLAIDDAHWADAASLRFLGYLSRRLADLPVSIVLATRTGERADSLDAILANPQTTMLRPAPLSASGVGALVRASLPGAADELLAACTRVSRGNPFLVKELVRTMRAEGWSLGAEDAHRVDDLASETLARAALIRLRQLPPEAMRLAGALAVLGDEAPLARAASVAGLDPRAAASAANTLVGAEILTGAQSLGFVHPVVRDAVYDEVPDADRADAHLRAARVLSREPLAPELVAGQLVHARAGGATWVVDALAAAADAAAARGDQVAAVRYLGRAIEEPPPADRQGEILLALASAEAALGDENAFTRLDRALERAGAPRERAEILLSTGRSLALGGRMADAVRAFERGSEELASGADADPEDELALELRASYGLAAIYGSAVTAKDLAAIGSIAADPAAPRTRGERSLLAALAGAQVLRSEDPQAILDLARRAWDGGALLQDETADSVNAFIPSFATWIAGEPEEAARMCAAAIQEARDRGSPMGYANACYYRIQVLYRLGRLSEAIADGEALLDGLEQGWSLAPAGAAGLIAMCLLDRDEPAEAKELLARFPPEEHSSVATNGHFHKAAAHLALAEGDPRRALESTGEGERLCSVAECVNPSVLDWRSPAALAHSQLGDAERARDLAAENVALARAFGEPRALGVALHTAALVAADEEQAALFDEAVATLRRSSSLLELSRALVERGAAIRRAGASRVSREPLREALELADRCQAGALRRRADEELAASGAKPRRTALRGPDSLTPAELRVARLAATGMTTRQIAQSLFVTPKTVEKHISNAYDKLGVRRRDALAGALGDGAVTAAAAAAAET